EPCHTALRPSAVPGGQELLVDLAEGVSRVVVRHHNAVAVTIHDGFKKILTPSLARVKAECLLGRDGTWEVVDDRLGERVDITVPVKVTQHAWAFDQAGDGVIEKRTVADSTDAPRGRPCFAIWVGENKVLDA